MTEAALTDSYGRAIRDLRVSVTDRCNFRCFYCLPHGEPPAAPKESMLTYEEIERAVRLFVSLGVEKVRLTGGEPMLRRDIETLVGKLARVYAAHAVGGGAYRTLQQTGFALRFRVGEDGRVRLR